MWQTNLSGWIFAIVLASNGSIGAVRQLSTHSDPSAFYEAAIRRLCRHIR